MKFIKSLIISMAAICLLPTWANAKEEFSYPRGIPFMPDPRDAPLPVRVCPSNTAAECAATYYKLADTDLNFVYGAARARLQTLQLMDAERQLVLAQREWIRFRDAHCKYERVYGGHKTGSFQENACLEVETIRRAFYLRRFMN